MKKIILLVEDDEIGRMLAKDQIIKAGFGIVIADNLDDAKKMLAKVKVSGIVTDIHFPQRPKGTDSGKPSGIAIVSMAVEQRIPVVIFSSFGHEADYLKDFVKSLEKLSGMKIPFVGKDPEKAVSEIKNIIGGV